MSDFQKKWETYKGYRIEPDVKSFDGDPETNDKWFAWVYISLATGGKPVEHKVEGNYESEEDAYRAAVEYGKKVVDSM